MTDFDIYAFADYSGSKSEYQQKRAIALSVINNHKKQLHKGYTRKSLRNSIQSLLVNADRENQRVIFGFDHSYSFPVGFYEVITGERWKTWDQILDLLFSGTFELQSVLENNAREWAKTANDLICKRLELQNGPFWGPFSYQVTKPAFPFGNMTFKDKRLIFKERRFVEEICIKTKSIYQIGGIGSVGLQSVYGIQNLAKLRHDLKNVDIKLFCWPFDGWDLPSNGHVLVEIYPALVNKGLKSDENDAEACSKWLYRQDRDNKLINLFKPKLTKSKMKRASLEGWIIGIR